MGVRRQEGHRCTFSAAQVSPLLLTLWRAGGAAAAGSRERVGSSTARNDDFSFIARPRMLANDSAVSTDDAVKISFGPGFLGKRRNDR